MAVGPGGSVLEGAPCSELSTEEAVFAHGLESIIDRALASVRPGERFVYGIHQALPEQISECIVRRYLAAGWAEAVILPGLTGAATLVLAP